MCRHAVFHLNCAYLEGSQENMWDTQVLLYWEVKSTLEFKFPLSDGNRKEVLGIWILFITFLVQLPSKGLKAVPVGPTQCYPDGHLAREGEPGPLSQPTVRTENFMAERVVPGLVRNSDHYTKPQSCLSTMLVPHTIYGPSGTSSSKISGWFTE